ncbi:hypothetical protein EDD37DRAFT_123244 [Exophiala viscosa]|uniref:Uncharacterized protein n=1 Tax=Exophiala viscosa TaxID=2486360 RepID=A0AAN6IEA5_9EURO|nr:hypothetical protein EDD36DRAFT_223536 [Exophiala viscosa]KAI1621570.1 hypothetical protein EDD37DRAFT_123244 [Exophiala viscosa]
MRRCKRNARKTCRHALVALLGLVQEAYAYTLTFGNPCSVQKVTRHMAIGAFPDISSLTVVPVAGILDMQVGDVPGFGFTMPCLLQMVACQS